MGAGQSSDGTSDARAGQDVKTSYYELLGVQRLATEEEIKKAYRRKALELHPDRNYGNEEETTRIFAEVQAAYEILSDAQERAWYDSHESAILRGDDGADEEVHTYENVRVTTADDLARTLRRFNSNVDFTDAPSGFFGFLREQFEHLAKEEEAAATWERVDVSEYPTFGHKDDTHDDVVKQFYTAWANFSTVKTFAWKDKYRLSEAPDRRIRRLMEKENSNLRQEAIREFNEAVRSFVLFVRKRDPRYKPSTQSEAERQKTLRDAAAAQAARARAANLAKLEGEVPEWTKLRDPEELDESEEEEIEEVIFECVVCNKTFKSEKQYEAHERSKKHQKAISALQKKMRKDNKRFGLQGEDSSGASTPVYEEVVEESGDLEEPGDREELNEDIEIKAPIEDENRLEHDDQSVSSDGEDDQSKEREEHRKTDADSGPEDVEDDDNDNDDYASPNTIAARLQDTHLEHAEEWPDTEPAPETRKMGKAAQKRAKRAATATAIEESENKHTCATCNAAFPSRSRLFQHIKNHDHGTPVSSAGVAKGKKGKGKR